MELLVFILYKHRTSLYNYLVQGKKHQRRSNQMKITTTEQEIFEIAQELFAEVEINANEVARNAFDIAAELKIKNPIMIVDGIDHDYDEEFFNEPLPEGFAYQV